MEEMKLYIVTKSSTDQNIKVGDIIWLSENRDLYNAMDEVFSNGITVGWLSECEWNVSGTNDFEYKEYNLLYKYL